MKHKTTIVGMLFLMSALLSIPAQATLNASSIYGPPDDGQMTYAEAQATISGCSTIRYYFSINSHYQYLQNYCGSNTIYSVVYGAANYIDTYPYDFATTFYKGDSHFLNAGQYPNPHDDHKIFWLYSNVFNGTYSDHIWDEVLGQYTTHGIQKFAFLWTCSLANPGEFGGIDGTDIWGMAPAWLHVTSLEEDSYNDPDYTGKCYIGFQCYSKPWTDYTGYYSYTYQTFATMFYYYATVSRYTIRNSLNQASLNYLGKAFDSQNPYNELYWGYDYQGNTCKLRIFGDPSMTLP
jgi:hypothetical protein